MSEPSFDALDIIEVAASLALSAASSPASRIARRALGLAAIAAAAAVSAAASISRLIAALAILSIVVLLLFEFLVVEDLATEFLPSRNVGEKTVQRRNGSAFPWAKASERGAPHHATPPLDMVS